MDCTNTNHSSDPQTLSMISTQTEPLSIYYTWPAGMHKMIPNFDASCSKEKGG